MGDRLAWAIERLRVHEGRLRGFGVVHAVVFGSVARGEDGGESDVDVVIELDRDCAMGIFEYARVRLYIDEILEGSGDVVNRRMLKPMVREGILRDAVDVF